MNLRLKFIVPQVIDGIARRKAIFEAVEFKDGKPLRKPEGGFVQIVASDGKPITASLLLGEWKDGTGLLHATVKRGSHVREVEKFILSPAGAYTKARLPDGSESMVATLVSGYHAYVTADIERRVKDGKPVIGADGREVFNVIDPEWMLFQSASGTFTVSAEPKEQAVAVDLEASAA